MYCRLESQKNGAFAQLNESYAKWIVKLIDQQLITFEGKLMFPPSKPTVGVPHVSLDETRIAITCLELLLLLRLEALIMWFWVFLKVARYTVI